MLLALPFEALYLLHRLHKAGYESYLVGGAVRDLLLQSLGRQTSLPHAPITDYDVTTNATPSQIQAVFPDSFYENNFGTVSITHPHLLELMQTDSIVPNPLNLSSVTPTTAVTSPKIIDLAAATKLHDSLIQPTKDQQQKIVADKVHPFEITTYRSDGAYQDHRRPESVSWGNSITEDLDRRDFTVNAIALSVSSDLLDQVFTTSTTVPTEIVLHPTQYQLIDPHHGMNDLSTQTLKTVGVAAARFNEDALRMLRAVRLACQLGFEIEPTTEQAIKEHSELLTHISGERIRDEFIKMLAGSRPREAVTLLDDTQLLGTFLPELLSAKSVAQSGHHTTDVWVHSLDALDNCPSTDPIVRLATLLHDVGKPATQRFVDGSYTFYNHEIVGARMVKQIAFRLRLSGQESQRLYMLVRHHMFHYQPHNTDAAIRRFMRKVSLENIDDILDVREGDRLGSGARKTSWRLEEMKQRMIEQLHQPMDLRDLAINGSDLMTELQLQPGPILGKILHELFERVLDNPELNQKDKLLEISREILQNQT